MNLGRFVPLGLLLWLAASDPTFAERRPVTTNYFGTPVVDPYRYMETPGDPSFAGWLQAESARTRAVLDALPGRPAVEAAVRAEARDPVPYSPTVVAGLLFFERDDAGNAAIHVRRLAGGADRTIVDARTLGPGKSAGAFAPSPDGSLLAVHVYGRERSSEIWIVRVADSRRIEVPLKDSVFDALDWYSDGRHILYDRLTPRAARSGSSAPAAKVFVHRLASAQDRDCVVFGTGVSPRVPISPDAFAFVGVPAGSRWAIAEVRDTSNRGSHFYTAPQSTLGRPGTPWRALAGPGDRFTDIAVHGDLVDLATPRDAPNYRVVRSRLDRPFSYVTVLPASERAVVSGTLDFIPKAGIFALNSARDADYVQLLEAGTARLARLPWNAGARPQRIPLPLSGSILTIATDPLADGALFSMTNWTDPGDIYAYAPGRGQARPTGFGRDAAFVAVPRVADELEATAPDGTLVPVSVVHAPGIALDGSHPVLLQTIGAYGFSTTPAYDIVPDAWLALGGIYAVAHVRGGGEFGERWRAAGRGRFKANTWKDLIAAAQLLVARGYTTPRRLGLYAPAASYLGGAGSGIAAGRALEERPDLFSAAVFDAPAFDMLRAETTATGRTSLDEFGSVATRDGYDALAAMSPYAHLVPGTAYPRILVRSFSKMSGIGEDWEAAKFVAALQDGAHDLNAAFLDVPTTRSATARVDRFAFLLAHAAAPSK